MSRPHEITEDELSNAKELNSQWRQVAEVPPDLCEFMKEAYDDGATPKEISEKVGFSRSCVRMHAERRCQCDYQPVDSPAVLDMGDTVVYTTGSGRMFHRFDGYDDDGKPVPACSATALQTEWTENAYRQAVLKKPCTNGECFPEGVEGHDSR